MRKAIVLVSLAVLFLGCDSKQPVAATPVAAATTTSATPSTPAVATSEYIASGPLVVERQIDVAAQRAGVVEKIFVEVGQRVHKGELLAEIDNRQLVADRDAAEARVKSTQFELEHWQAEVKVRDSDRSRDEEMYKAGLITEKQLEHSRYTVTGGQYEAQREQQNLRNAQESLRSLQLELEKTRIIAPFDGVVARRYIREGQKLSAGDRTFWVSATAPIEVRFTLPQEFVGRVHAGQEVSVASLTDPRRPQRAKIKIISPVVDPSSGTIEVSAQLSGEPAGLLPGMTVNVHIPKQ